jgi:predicted Zn-ribbon and HTH transcriptional regulator
MAYNSEDIIDYLSLHDSPITKKQREIMKNTISRIQIDKNIEKECNICTEEKSTFVISPCLHYICKQCFDRIIEKSNPTTCPMCRGPMSQKISLKFNLTTDGKKKRKFRRITKKKG